ncbi:3-3-hydroxy-phenylpropionate/3-hydroxycinnamic acid hydroxylase [Asticcacaulis biprosthecium C19]|uniref:3-3-hydroxy-phenylpropionate/3-hydroxycinnamic acid hydroxylase n=1 Tax=Asticcacaulis biprosthecium C19 TaxID=715226 RepID=F4QNX0_9CAUL|nr:bifunctional 3-(3-hydroxy-phenyl)propionate/3-hydroxycinnamic acid hydroxylase [Asticcacaulis biprosthecium]EGF91028.1 3-3-hydroxy-phenylpropionate/3-hydroxycinnamic acid hydroxylase [Asticcacaulis biprosthecium C19]
MIASDTTDFDVIIIGCGPVGATAANLLGQAGHRVAIVDQFTDVFTLPRAVHIDHEMMRLFQNLGLAETLLPHMRETQGHMHLGADGDVIRYMGSAGKPRPYGWANDYFFYQPELESALRDGFRRFGNVAFIQGVRATVEGTTVASGDRIFRARYIIACDGARSPTRESLGISLDDLLFEESWLVVDANVDGPISFPAIPSLPADSDPQQLSIMTCDPRRPATIVPGRGAHRRWEFMLLPGESETAIVEPASIQALIGPWLKGCRYDIVRTATYRFNARVARQWRQGSVFLAGDAAHQTPPFFGQGMCHGLRDAANLCFKLDLVLRGHACDALLDTYQPEREPQVRHVIGAAVAAGRYICELDPDKAAERDETLRRRQREGQDIATAADLIAPYTNGLVAPGAGERFIQPRVANGLLLDDVIPPGFVLLTRRRTDHPLLSRLGIAQHTIDPTFDTTGALTAALDQHDAQAILLRPDRYVFGWGSASHLLDLLSAQLAPQELPLHA